MVLVKTTLSPRFRRAIAVLPLLLGLTACGAAGPATSDRSAKSPQASLAPGTIQSVSFSRSIDKSGRATSPTNTFRASQDQDVFMVVRVANVPSGAKISYVRTSAGKLVDAKSVIARPNVGLVYFHWKAAPGKSLAPGQYEVRLYLNGSRAWGTGYEVVN